MAHDSSIHFSPADDHLLSSGDGGSARSDGTMCKVASSPAFFSRSTRAGSWRSTQSALAYSPRSRRTWRILCLSTSVTMAPSRHGELHETASVGSTQPTRRRQHRRRSVRRETLAGCSPLSAVVLRCDVTPQLRRERGRLPVDAVAQPRQAQLEHPGLWRMAEQPDPRDGLRVDAPLLSGLGRRIGHGRLLHDRRPGRTRTSTGDDQLLGRNASRNVHGATSSPSRSAVRSTRSNISREGVRTGGGRRITDTNDPRLPPAPGIATGRRTTMACPGCGVA